MVTVRKALFFLSCTLCLLVQPVGAAPAAGQQPLDRPLRVFLDCNQFHCDQDFFTQEVPWVSFVRDRQVADVHVLGTRQSTGGGGSVYTLEFRGQSSFEGQGLTLRASTAADATELERRNELLRRLRVGLAPFAAGTSVAPAAEFTLAEAEEEEGQAAAEEDPWDRWVFQVGVNGFANGESQQQFVNAHGNTSASRVTEDWKMRVGVGGGINRQEFESDEITRTFQTESFFGNGMLVKSLGPRWGAGAISEWRRSTFNNYGHTAALGAAVEYNIFPYSESNRRLLTLSYVIGPRYNVYQDSTIFRETEELLIHQLMQVTYEVIQPWGNVNVSTNLSHYVTKFGEGREWEEPQYNVGVSGGFDLRLIRGLSLRTNGSISMIRDQIQLRLGDLSDEEILTRQRELATDYRYFMSFGLSYRFGSIFSDVVNPRFQGI